MPETGTNILSYVGDKNLGAGANAGISVINPNNNLNTINDTANNIMQLNHLDNVKLYDQKIRDRDTTLGMIQDGQIASGKIDPNDRPMYEKARQDVQDSFYKMIDNGGVNNRDAVKDYYDKVANLKNITDWAQSRELGFANLQAQRAAQTLPEDQKLYDDAIASAKKQPFWNPIPVVQKAFNYDINAATNDVLPQPTTVGTIGGMSLPQSANQTTWNTTTTKNGVQTQKTTVKNAPNKSAIVDNKTAKQPITISGTSVNPDGTISPYSFTPEKYIDFGQIKNIVDEKAATNPTANYTYRSYLNDVQNPNKTPPQEQARLMASYNNRIATYSQQRGIIPIPGQTNPDGTSKYPDQINYHQNPDGSVVIQETPQSFFAKHALASVNGDYVQTPQAEFNKDIANYDVQKQRANTDTFYKHVMANVAQKKADAYVANVTQQMKLRGNQADQDNFLGEIYKKNLLQQPSLIGSGKQPNSFNFSPLQANNSLPVYTIVGNKPVQLQPIGATAKTDALGKFQYWQGGHYNINYLKDGQPLSSDQIAKSYAKFKEQMGDKWDGSLNDYLKQAIKTPQTGFTFTLQGANGVTDENMSAAAQRIISNTNTKKGQEPVFSSSDNTPPSNDTNSDENNNDDNQ